MRWDMQWLFSASVTLYVLDYPYCGCWWNVILCNSWVIILLKIYKPAFLLIKHLCSIRTWVHTSVCLSLSLSLLGWFFFSFFFFFCLSLSLSSADFLGTRRPVLLTLLPGLLRLSLEGALCLHLPWEGARCLRERHKSCVEGFIGFLHKPGSISLFLSLHFLIVASGPPGPSSLKDPSTQHFEITNKGK